MYDAIIVGARCAGAPTALLLAQSSLTRWIAQLEARWEGDCHP
ncbi:MAG TPA: hypothetical protein VGJ33_09090 [Candidatus Angelobacter sp.]